MSDAPSQDNSADPLNKVVRIGQLLDLHGGLLTERQRKFVQLHYEDDLSFGEIAKSHGVSRQAIHDAAKHAEQALEQYEEKLGLLKRGFSGTPSGLAAGPEEAVATPDAGTPGDQTESAPAPVAPESADRLAKLAAGLREAEERVRRSGGIIYNGEGLAKELDAFASEAEALSRTAGAGGAED